MDGQVRDMDGKPVAGAIVDVWHANTLGGYSFFDPSQPKFNLAPPDRNRCRWTLQLPLAAAVRLCLPAERPDAEAARLNWAATATGRRISTSSSAAPNYRKLTTQINIDGDAYLHDDFAFATRDGLIPEVRRSTDPVEIRDRGLNAPFAADHLRLRSASRGGVRTEHRGDTAARRSRLTTPRPGCRSAGGRRFLLAPCLFPEPTQCRIPPCPFPAICGAT